MPANETIRVSIRVRPVTDGELVRFPPPLPVHAAPGEVRVYNTPAAALHAPKARDLNSSLAVVSAAKRPAGTPPAPLPLPTGSYQGYPFSAVFGPEASDDQVYVQSGCHKVVASVCQGCNGTVFVYGQTGAGKTFSCDALTSAAVQQVFAYGAAGSSSSEGGADAAPSSSRGSGPEAALSPAAEGAGATGAMDVQVSVCVLELYNEVLRCLLSAKEVVLMMGPGGLLLDGAVEQPCSSAVALQAAIASAKANRVVGETRANARSSRSHLIIRIRVQAVATQAAAGAASSSSHAAEGACAADGASSCAAAAGPTGGGPGSCTCTCGVLNLVDLAGSERVDKTGSMDSTTRLREALNINKSLLCLGNVVTALADSADGRKVHVPYRDSKLTRLLEDSLGGSARTALLACITPLPDWHLELTKATLAFAARAARIVCRPQRNMVVLPAGPGGLDQQALVEALQAEVAALRAQLAAAAAAASAAQQLVGAGMRLSRASSAETGLSSPRSASLLLQQPGRPSSQPLPMMDEGDGEAGDQDQSGSSSGKVGRSTMLWRLIAGPRLHPPPGGSEDQGVGGSGGEGAADPRGGVLGKRWATFAVRKSRTVHLPSTSEAAGASSADGSTSAGFSASLPAAGSGGSGWGSQYDANSLPGSRLVFSADGCVDVTGRRQWSSGGGATDASSGCTGGVGRVTGVADSLVPQLLGVLAAKKAELAALQQQLAGMTTQLGKAAADKERQDRQLCELAAGLSALSAARQAERRNWAAQLEALEGGLEGARAEVEQHRNTASQLRQQLRELTEGQQQQQGSSSSAATMPAAAVGDLMVLLSAVAQHQPPWLAELPLKVDVPALQRLLLLQQQQAAAGALDRCPSHPVGVDSLSGSGTLRASLASTTGAVPCKKCEATKPLLAFLQKLKEQVQLLGQQLAAKDAELAATRTAAAQLRSQLARLGGGCGAASSLGMLSSSSGVMTGGSASPRTSASPITTQ